MHSSRTLTISRVPSSFERGTSQLQNGMHSTEMSFTFNPTPLNQRGVGAAKNYILVFVSSVHCWHSPKMFCLSAIKFSSYVTFKIQKSSPYDKFPQKHYWTDRNMDVVGCSLTQWATYLKGSRATYLKGSRAFPKSTCFSTVRTEPHCFRLIPLNIAVHFFILKAAMEVNVCTHTLHSTSSLLPVRSSMVLVLWGWLARTDRCVYAK